MRIIAIFSFLLLFTGLNSRAVICFNTAEIKTVSPSGEIEIKFRLNPEGVPQYKITYRGYSFLNWSGLGMKFDNGELSGGFKIVSTKNTIVDETYRLVSGKSKYSRNYCNETKIILKETSGRKKTLELFFRAYDDGAAFRYGLPEQESFKEFVLSTEETYFNFAGNYTCWAMKKPRFRHSYEGEYLKYRLRKIDNTPGDSTSQFPYITLPLTMEIKSDIYVCLTEANITDYAGMYLVKEKGNSLKSILSPDTSDSRISVRGKTPAVSPWRVFIIGDKPGRLIESNLILNLNEPSKIKDTEWIKPGKTTWSWWAEERGFEPEFSYQILANKTVKYYIDFAASNNFQYVILDGGWYGWFDATKDDAVHDITKTLPELDLPMMASYADSKGIGLILWVVWYELERQMSALDYYQSLGIKGIKIDFIERDNRESIDFNRKIAEECAKRNMIVMYHGAYKPDGLARTYPNILTYESVLGNEYARWITGLPHPEHNVTLPFTRMIAGPMDYTPGSMTNSTEESYIGRWKMPMTKGTRANQLAMLVVYESGIQSLCESAKIYETLPEFEFVKQVPASWDSTIVLESKIGDYIVIARKHGKDWFIGAMTDRAVRYVKIDFGFLEEGNYTAETYIDGTDADKNPGSVKIASENITNSMIKTIRLAKGGGAAMILKKVR